MKTSGFSITPAEFDFNDLWLAMGCKGSVPDAGIRSLAEEIANEIIPAARMQYMYSIVEASKLSAKEVLLGGVRFGVGPVIGSYLQGMTNACVFVATAGLEFNAKVAEIRSRGDIAADFIADSIGSVLAELAVSRLEEELGLESGLSLSYSPGYCGWDVREQQKFFMMFPPEPCGVRLSESSLMSPEKSISGFFAIGEHLVRQPYHCHICNNKQCYKRKDA